MTFYDKSRVGLGLGNEKENKYNTGTIHKLVIIM